ncbi:beta-ketoacyl synthase N-terminal-like domain-containing protein, partial [Streptomyces zhaozhouensis]|uniref:beta-ketoacyl synthase N-terminal-like domain-containing protein n=1 Tax=Streptomyces zhaozhouensis TaxID=1300267 RepID=UPI001FE3C49F
MNDYIRWDDSPFYVNRETREWPEPEDGRLVGAVSAFGMSGTNAHIVVESHDTEAEAPARAAEWPDRPAHLLALSATSQQALERRITDLIDYLAERPSLTGRHLSAISVELLDGRQHFSHRCAVVVRDREDALDVLREARAGESHPNVFTGTVERGFTPRAAIQRLVGELAGQAAAAIDESAQYRDHLQAQADLYCQGYGVPSGGRAAVVPALRLPGYPFAADAYRPEPGTGGAALAIGVPAAAGGGARGGAALHPLVHRNASDVGGLRFVTEFSGRESFVTGGVLVADALLEMVRASVALSVGGSSPTDGGGVELRDVVWHEGVPAAGGAVEVGLLGQAGGRLSWEVLSGDPNDPELEFVHGVGGARRVDASTRVVDLDAMAELCAEPVEVAGEQRRVAAVHAGESGRRVLVRLEPGRSTVGGDVVLQPGDALAALEAVAEANGRRLASASLLGARRSTFAARGGVTSSVVATVTEVGNGRVVVDLDGCDASGGVLWSLQGVEYGESVERGDVSTDGESEEPAEVAVVGPGRRGEMRGWSVEECALWELQDAVCTVLKLPRENVDPAENLAEFGFDSINLATFAEELSGRFGFEVTPDVFFGYPTLRRLTGYLLEARGDELAAFYRDADVVAASPVLVPAMVSSGVRRRGSRRVGGIRGGDEPVAVVGMSGRFPGVRDVEGLWSVLAEGRSVIGGVPADRVEWWRAGGSGEEGVRAGFVPGVAEFDPLFFQISPAEAETMDPRQRLLLQESWNALEDAGYGERRLNGERVGVFVGAEEGDYQHVVGEEGNVTGSSNSILASRLAYFLNFDGPGMLISTACSSGLVAVHQACQSLQAGECDVAVVAGVNLML